MDKDQSAVSETTELQKQLRTRVIRILVMLAEMYPYSTIAKKLDVADQRSFNLMVNAWAVAIKPLTEQQTDLGLQRVLKAGSQFEPSMPAFIQTCRGVTGKAYTQYKPPPKPKASGAVVVGEIIKMRGILNRER